MAKDHYIFARYSTPAIAFLKKSPPVEWGEEWWAWKAKKREGGNAM